MINEDREWEYSLVTFVGGNSYNIGGMRFVRGMPKKVTKLAIRKALEGVDGFQVGDIYKPEEAPVPFPVSDPEEPEEVEEAEAPEETPEPEPKPKPKVVKRKKTVKKKIKAPKKGDE